MERRTFSFHWSIALLVAAHLLVWDVAPWTGMGLMQSHGVTEFYYASYFVQLGLVSLWLALGTADWKLRFTICPLAIVHVRLAAWASCDYWKYSYHTYVAAIHSIMVIAVAAALRAAGMRLARRGLCGERPGLPLQLSIRAVLCVTAAIAVWLGLYLPVTQQDMPRDDDTSILPDLLSALGQCMVYSVEFLTTSIIALRAKRLLVVSPFLVAISPLAGFAESKTLSLESDVLFYLWFAFFEAVVLLASIAVLRAAGYRLVGKAEQSRTGKRLSR